MKKQDVQEAIQARTDEVALYTFNAQNFERAISKLPKEWDDASREIKKCGPNNEQEALLLGLHEFRDELMTRRIAELVQRQRAVIILEALQESYSYLKEHA